MHRTSNYLEIRSFQIKRDPPVHTSLEIRIPFGLRKFQRNGYEDCHLPSPWPRLQGIVQGLSPNILALWLHFYTLQIKRQPAPTLQCIVRFGWSCCKYPFNYSNISQKPLVSETLNNYGAWALYVHCGNGSDRISNPKGNIMFHLIFCHSQF